MAARIRSLLTDLHSSLSNKTSDSDLTNADLIRDISSSCTALLDSSELDHICAIVFDPAYGIVEFLKKCATNDQYKNSKFEALDFLERFVDKANKHVTPSIIDIKNVCLTIFTWEKAAKTRSATFPLLIKVLHLAVGSLSIDDLNVPDLTDKIFTSLCSPSKLVPTVRQGIYHVLGIITEIFPECMDVYSQRLLDVYIGALKQQMTSKTKSPEMPIIAGCLFGLNGLLTSFPKILEENPDDCKCVFKYAYMGVVPDSNLKRFEVPRAALTLFSKHSCLFSSYIYADYHNVYQRLHSWSLHKNKETNTIAFVAVESFLREIAAIIAKKGKDDKDAKSAFAYFLGTFKSAFKNFSTDSFAREVSVAIKGFGYLARPCRLFMNPAELGVMFQEVTQLCERAYMGQSYLIEDKILYLPSLLESLASIVAEIEEIPEVYLHSLQNLCLLLMENYPIVPAKIRFTAHHAIAKLLFSLYSKGKTFRMFASHVVYQGVLRSCSHPVPNEEINSAKELFFQQDPHRITYKEYLSLWNNLLTITSMKIDVEQYNISLEDRHIIVKTLYEDIVKSILTIVNKLDLSSTREEVSPDNLPSDPVVGLQAKKPKDFQIFFNLVEFGRVLLLSNHIGLFQPWVFTFSKDVISLSTKYPLVSGLYKLFATCLTICSRIKFFKDILKEEQMQTDQREETLICYSLFVKFALEVTVLLKQFKDDLLVSCLSVILSLPKEIVIPHIQAVIPALQLTFKIGLSYLPLAIEGLETLERWSYELPRDVIQPYYSDVLPLLNAYLKTHGDGISEDWSVKDSALEIVSKKQSRGPKRLTIKFIDQSPHTTKESTALMEVKMKIIALLGKLGGSVNRYLIMAKPDLLSEKAVVWDMDKYLKFAVPFPDMKPIIFIDDFLQQTVQLCFSSERQTKVSACELLHATVLFMLGTKVQMPDNKSSTPFAKLYKHTFPALLQLSCDIDEISRQLFKPFVFQLIHWFTSKTMFGSEETLILLNAILEGISNSTDSSLRDFCAECIKEYLSWSIKQTTSKELEKHPYNATALLKRLCSLCLHPSPWCRLGACLAFNHIYTVLREEESLVDSFIFELLAHFVDCLSISHKDDAALGTLDQSKQALNHIERIVVHKAAVLKSANSKRKVPRGWLKATLEEAVDWLLVQCGRPQTEARHKCMELVFRFAPLLKDKTTVGDYFSQLNAVNGTQFIISRFEGGGLLDMTGLSLRKCPTLSDMEKTCFTSILSWFDLLLATLDCYVWALEQRLMKLGNISKSDENVLFKSVKYFVVSISNWSIYDVVKNMKGQAKAGEIYSPLEIEMYNRKKCTVMIRLMNMVQTMIKVCVDSSDSEVLGTFFQIPIWHLIIKCILKPATIGFDIAELEIMEKLPVEIEQLLKTMKTKLPADEHDKFVKILATEIKEDETLDLQRQLAVGVNNYTLSLGLLVNGYEKLYEAGFLNQDMHMLLPEKLLEVIVDIGLREVKILEEKNVTPTIQMLGRRILLFAFALNLKVETFVSLLFETSPVAIAGRKSSTQKGMTIYILFEDTINECLAKNAEEVINILVKRKSSSSVAMISSILVGMLRFLASKDIITRYGNAVTKAILLNWCHLKPIWFTDCSEESQSSVLMIMTKIMIIGSEILSDCNHPAFKSLFVTYLDMLSSRKTKLSFKARLFDLLPSFSTLPEEDTSDLHERLTEFVANNFPMKSSELVKTGMNRDEFVFAFVKLLKAFEISGCIMLLKLIISITCNEPKHICEDEIGISLRKFMKCLPADKQLEALTATFIMFFEDDDCPAQFKKQIMKRICVPLLQCANRVSVGKFFEANIVKIMSSLQAKQSKGSEERFEAQLILKTGCFQLMEAVYVRLGKEELYTKGAAIVEAYCMGKSSTGKELTQEITKLAHNAKKENVQGETILMELRREYHCAALNVLVAVITCTQTEEKFYTAFLFSENIKKGDYLWENIIDMTGTLGFEMELESKMERKQQMVNIRNAARAKRKEEMDEMDESDEEVENYVSSVHYLTSQYLADSSLSEDVGKFDFSSSLQNVSLRSGNRLSDAVASTSKGSNVISERKEIVNLEMDELNEHDCMPAFTSVCMHLVKSGISKAPPKGETQCSMPTWMSALHKKFSDTETHNNIRLFIAKIIVNCDNIFAPYAKDWLYPMMQLVVNEAAGLEINYFVADIMATILSWSTVAIPEDNMMSRAMASKLLEFLMQAAHYPRKDILRNNLEIVKTVVECWKPRLEIPIRCIYENLKDPNIGSKSNVVGLQLLAIILANGLPPFFPTTGLDEKRFLEAVAANLVFTYRIVYGVAAEVVGMILKYMCEKEKFEKVMESGFYNLVVKKLQDLNTQKKQDQFLFCLFKIHIYDANIVAKFMNRLLFLVPSMQGVYKEYCLQLIISRINHVDDPYIELRSRGLEQFLQHREAQVQFLSLQIVKSVLRQLKPEELLNLLSPVTSAFTGKNAKCRDVVYDICSWIFDNYSDETKPECKKIQNFAKETMIRGLVDEDVQLRRKVFNFWSQDAHLATTTIERMSSLLRDLYSPSTEHKFLSYCTFLILEMTSRSPDYERKMFEYSLQECKFEDYRLNSSWKARHRSMLPLFLNTVTSQMDEDVSDQDTTNDNIRATQGIVQFTPTQANMGTQGNWMTPATISDISLNSLSQSTELSQSSLLFSVGKKLPSALKYGRKREQLKAVGPNFGKGKLELPATDGQIPGADEKEDYHRLRRRFLKDKEGIRNIFMKRQMRLKKTREDLIQSQRGRREAQVTIYRSYRKGDLPDIQINYSAIIAPMQALAQRDDNFARILFTSLIRGILHNIKTESEDLPAVKSNIAESFNNIVRTTTQYNPSIVGSVLDIWYLEYENLQLDVEDLVTAATMSKQQNTAILFLEKIISKETSSVTVHAPKKMRLERNPPPVNSRYWIKMAELYKSIRDYDSVSGIFAFKLNTREVTRLALKAETLGDFSTALKHYEKVYNQEKWPEGNPEQCELDLWDDSIMQCYNNLTQWNQLEQHSLANIDNNDINTIWDDIYKQEHYLPFIIRSKVKKLLEGQKNEISLWPFVEATLDKQYPERKEFLQTRYSADIALLCILHEDYARASHYYNASMENFIREWATMTPLSCDILQQSLLCDLQKLIEMKEFLDAISKNATIDKDDFMRYVRRWQHRMPDALDSVGVWDDIVCTRTFYMRQLAKKAERLCDDSVAEQFGVEIGKLCWEGDIHSKLSYVDSICQQGNTSVALKYLKAARKVTKVLNNQVCNVKFMQSYFRTQLKMAKNSTGLQSLNTVLSAWEQLEKEEPRDHLALSVVQHGLHCDAAKHVIDTVQQHEVVLSLLPEKEARTLLRRLNCDSLRPRDVLQSAFEFCFRHLKEAVEKQTDEKSYNYNGSLATAHLNLAKFCDSYMSGENSEFGVFESQTKFSEVIIDNLLQAMKLGSHEACVLFPKILPIIESTPDSSTIFRSKVLEVPTWMFLRWISQLVALLDKSEGPAVMDLILAMTKDYPQAVIYPFKVSSNSYTFKSDQKGRKCELAVEKIKALLSEQQLATKFVAALDLFRDPVATLKDAKRTLLSLLKKKDKLFEKELRKLYHDIFDCISHKGRENDVPYGEFHIKFAKKHVKEMEKMCGKDCCKASKLTIKDMDVIQMIIDIYKNVKEDPVVALKHYSPWLSAFNSAKFGNDLEIPGQYTGLRKPLPEYHVKISGFDETVMVLESMRRPKRITIRGNDEKEYKFLVKSGEDLRLDQRIEQLFGIMNEIYKNDRNCNMQRLQLVTFQVVPLTDNLGLLEWINDTVTLNDFIFKSVSSNDKKTINGICAHWNVKIGGQKCVNYDMLYKVPRNDVVRRFDDIVSTIRPDILRQSFSDLSSSAEAFFTIRSNFMRSHAVLCVSQYILGIGDRHLKNFMVCMRTGTMIGIDFGYSFGVATQILPVPELMPFRLTPQMLHLMEPLRANGTFRATMTHVLQALRANPDLLKSVMDIFVKEPSLDWQTFARIQAESLGMQSTDLNWYPKEKLNITLRKLQGDNSACIMRDELMKSVQTKKNCFKDMLAVCVGDKNHNFRAQSAEKNLSVDDQVSCLIDHAIDSNVMGRTFIGWNPCL